LGCNEEGAATPTGQLSERVVHRCRDQLDRKLVLEERERGRRGGAQETLRQVQVGVLYE